MKKTAILFVAIILILLICAGCQPVAGNEMDPPTESPIPLKTAAPSPTAMPAPIPAPTPIVEVDVEGILDNDSAKETLIKSVADADWIPELRDRLYLKETLYIEDIANRIGLECLREAEDVYYSVYKLDNGKYAYVFYREEKGGQLVVRDIYDRTVHVLQKDFDMIVEGATTYEEMCERYSPRPSPAGGEFKILYSFMDGGYAVIYYGYPGLLDYLDDPEGKEPPPAVVSRIEYNLDLKEVPPYEYFPYIMEKDLE